MIYGMYLSATGIITKSHQQDVIANNLANAETSGFKRQLALQDQRKIEAMVTHAHGDRAQPYDNIGGGQLLSPSQIDMSQGPVEQSSNPLDTAIVGKGFFAVMDKGEMRLTRNGQFQLDKDSQLITNSGQPVLDVDRKPLTFKGYQQSDLIIDKQGQITDPKGNKIGKIGLFDVADEKELRPTGDNMFAQTRKSQLQPATGSIQAGNVEKSNVDPANELTRLMETQRLLEANANMIKYQDQSLSRLITEVGKIT